MRWEDLAVGNEDVGRVGKDADRGSRERSQSALSPPLPASIPSRGCPTRHGAILGEALADIAKAGRVGADLPEMCATCAFREGTIANQMAATGMVALNCLLGVDDDDFACHHGMKDGEPTKICAGYLAALNAPFPVIVAAVSTVKARLDTMTGPDSVRADFETWATSVDPDWQMDNYQWGRAYLRRDSDRSGEASETGTGSTEGESAGRQASPT